jgi:hypothetical protein
MAGNIKKLIYQHRVQVPVSVSADRPASLDQRFQPVRIYNISFQLNANIGITTQD